MSDGALYWNLQNTYEELKLKIEDLEAYKLADLQNTYEELKQALADDREQLVLYLQNTYEELKLKKSVKKQA